MPDDCIYPKPNGWQVQVGTCTYGKNYLDQIEQTLKEKYMYLFNKGVSMSHEIFKLWDNNDMKQVIISNQLKALKTLKLWVLIKRHKKNKQI